MPCAIDFGLSVPEEQSPVKTLDFSQLLRWQILKNSINANQRLNKGLQSLACMRL
jgi:hypothetical protein